MLRTVTPNSFAEDPLRLVRGLRFVSQLDLDPDEQTETTLWAARTLIQAAREGR